MYYAPSTAHAPLQAPAEWIARFKGKFDAGWDAYREAAFARQKKLGVVPPHAKLAPMPEGTCPWSALLPDERKVAARWKSALDLERLAAEHRDKANPVAAHPAHRIA